MMDPDVIQQRLKGCSERVPGTLTKEKTAMNNVQFYEARNVAECGTMKAGTYIDDDDSTDNVFKSIPPLKLS